MYTTACSAKVAWNSTEKHLLQSKLEVKTTTSLGFHPYLIKQVCRAHGNQWDLKLICDPDVKTQETAE